MEAPAITTLPPDPEDDESPTPPPPPQSSTKVRIKLRVSEPKPEAASSAGGATEDEEDQLEDDDDILAAAAPAKPARQRGPRVRKPKAQAKEKDKPSKDDPPAAMMSAWQINVGQELPGSAAQSPDPSPSVPPPAVPTPVSTPAPSKPGRKRGTQSKKSTPTTAVIRVVKNQRPIATPDDQRSVSEAVPTAPPSPGNWNSPLPVPTPTTRPPPPDDFELPENILAAPPYYPLPDRQLIVLPPPKVTSVYATSTPLDIKGPQVKKWRLVYREIKGVGGSRWFTKTWVRDSDPHSPSQQKIALPAPKPARVRTIKPKKDGKLDMKLNLPSAGVSASESATPLMTPHEPPSVPMLLDEDYDAEVDVTAAPAGGGADVEMQTPAKERDYADAHELLEEFGA